MTQATALFPIPPGEDRRLAALDAYRILDTDVEPEFDRFTRLAAALTQSPISLITLIDSTRAWFKSRIGIAAHECPREDAFCAHALAAPTPLIVPDTTNDQRFSANRLVVQAPFIRSYAASPLVAPTGEILGTLCVLDTQARTMPDAHIHLLTDLAGGVVTTMELSRSMNEMRRLALTDALTGLPNRTQFFHALRAAIGVSARQQAPLSILYLDCDNFKKVNDVLGHHTGDAVLRTLADEMRAQVRVQDTPARLGGDEFAIVLPDTGPRAATSVAQRLLDGVGAVMGRKGWGVTVSIGAVSFARVPPDEDQALLMADRAMYAAKGSGKNRVHSVVVGHTAQRGDAAPVALVSIESA